MNISQTFPRKAGSAVFAAFLSFSWFFTPSVLATSVSVSLLPVPISVEVTPATVSLNPTDTQQYTAIAHFASDPDLDITSNSLTIWDTTTGDAAVSSTGLLTAISDGSLQVTATYGGVTGFSSVTITTPVVVPPVIPPVTNTGGGGAGGGNGGNGGNPPANNNQQNNNNNSNQQNNNNNQQNPPSNNQSQNTTPPPGTPAPGEEEFSPSPEGELPNVNQNQNQPNNSEQVSEVFDQDNPVFDQDIEVNSPPLEKEPVIIQTLEGPLLLPPPWTLMRGEAVARVLSDFDLQSLKSEVLIDAQKDLSNTMAIFLDNSLYNSVVLDTSGVDIPMSSEYETNLELKTYFKPDLFFSAPVVKLGSTQFYPDVPPQNIFAYPVNISTILAITQGYYLEENSPFKPYRVINRIEALKVLLGSLDLVKWLYYDELETTLGGINGVRSQTTPFDDVKEISEEGMWWFPRYINKACEVQMVDCTVGTNFRPGDYITEDEFTDMTQRLKSYFDDSKFLQDRRADPDNDQLKNYQEDTLFFTNPNAPDTDNDQLLDNNELEDYETSPFLGDTDGEGLDDYAEVVTYQTNPLKSDTDSDFFSDFLEIELGSDPLDVNSYPADENGNGVADVLEERYGLEINDGMTDTDGDGVSDKLEINYRTDPTKFDTDGDGFSDAEEILDLKTDPANPDDPSSLEALGVRITNFQENQLVGDTTPLIKGIAPANARVEIFLRNDSGHEKVLGETITGENNLFLFEPSKSIRDGKYLLIAKALLPEKRLVMESKPVRIEINSQLGVEKPTPKKLSGKDISEENYIKNVRIEIIDKVPYLIGETEIGSRVTATWKSLVTTSALISDAVSGEFKIVAPNELELGNHDVYVTATRLTDNAQSETIHVPFSIGVNFPKTDQLKAAAPESGLNQMVAAVAQQSGWLGWALLVAAVTAGAYYVKRRMKK